MAERTVSTATERAVEACQDALPPEFGGARLVFGFDGIIDNVRTMVDTRHSPEEFDRLATLAALRERVGASVAADSSLTIEWELSGQRTGGHACHLSRAFNRLGGETTLLGTYGDPVREIFESEFSESTIVSIGTPGVCDAVEFDDGKLLLTDFGEAAELDWELLTDRLDVEELADHLDGSDVLGVGYWNITSALPELVATLVEETWPRQESPPGTVFVDPGDIRNLPDEQVRAGAECLAAADETVPVTVSANRTETAKIATALGGTESGNLREDAETAHAGLGVETFVGHGRSESVGVDGSETVAIDAPTTDSPTLTTSAGDHFNVGFLLGQLHGLSLAPSTVLGNAVAGSFVRTGEAPTYDRIVDYVDGYLDRFYTGGRNV